VMAVIATSWLAVRNSTLLPSENFDHIVGIAEHIDITQMKPNGLPEYYAQVHNASQFQSGSTLFNNIHVQTVSYTPQPGWHLSAVHGKSNADNSKVTLWDNVKARRPAKEQFKPYAFSTSQVVLHPKKHAVDTTRPVIFFQPGTHNIIHGVGMHANTKTKIIHILSQVKSTYEVNSAKSLDAST